MAYGYTGDVGNTGTAPLGENMALPLVPDQGGGGAQPYGAYTGPLSPEFNPIQAPGYDFTAYQAPTGEDVLQDPSYKFRLGQGEQALERSAAAKGVLGSGGTLKDIMGYGQNFASQEYSNVASRALEAAKMKSDQEIARNQLLSGDYRALVQQETQRAMAENANRYNSWAKMGDWAHSGGGGGGVDSDPMPVWNY
jgi:hypothetical protein